MQGNNKHERKNQFSIANIVFLSSFCLCGAKVIKYFFGDLVEILLALKA